MRRRALLGAALALWAAAGPVFAATGPPAVVDLCPRVRLIGPDPGLNEVEKRLVCGNDQSEGWKHIPLNESEHFMRAFLQRRGYDYPRFSVDGERLTVRVGTQTLITKLVGRGLEGLYDLGKKRGVVGKPLTPEALDELKLDVSARLQEQGYACPTVDLDADARTGVVTVSADPGVYYLLTYIHQPRLDGLDPGVFDRFQAHQYGYPFDIRLLDLTAERIVQQALFQSAYYDVSCSTAGLNITQRVVEAKPHLVAVGFGVDTEGYAETRAQWRASRLGYRASSMEASLFASYREQRADALMHYYLRPSDRLNLVPRATLNRDNEVPYEVADARASLSPNWTWDDDELHLELLGGPVLEHINTLRGVGPASDTFFAFETRAIVTSHLFEYYQRDPRVGWQAGLQTSSRARGAYSDLSAQRLRLFGEKLWNVGHYDPPWLVLADRGWAGTVITDGDARTNTLLPPSQRFFIGGDVDLRGAQRQELPNDAGGFFTAVYDGLELRVNDVLPFKLDPLIFCDAAMGGRAQWSLDRDIYYSPGVGLRWASPFGVFRISEARGTVARRTLPSDTKLPHWQFFFSFGTEF